MTGFKALRKARNLTQDDLARRLGVGRTTVTMWETGQNRPRTADLTAIAEALGCDVNELVKALQATE